MCMHRTRKRQSCVVRTPDGRILLLCKGADNVMFERMKRPSTPSEIKNFENLKAHLDSFANVGLRTLVMTERELDQPV